MYSGTSVAKTVDTHVCAKTSAVYCTIRRTRSAGKTPTKPRPAVPPQQRWDDTPGGDDEAKDHVRRRAGGSHPRRHEPGGAGGDGPGGGVGDVEVSFGSVGQAGLHVKAKIKDRCLFFGDKILIHRGTGV